MLRRRRLEQPEPGFKDYYLMLQVHPEADAAMIDAAYWHLARRYGEARLTDDSARAKMDGLNEAYSVLRNSGRRDDFDRIRNILLGSNALPVAAAPPSERVPLSVMERQHPRARDATASAPRPAHRPRWPALHLAIPGWQHYLSALLFFALAVVALVWAQPLVVVVVFAVGVAVTLLPLVRRSPQAARRPNSKGPRPNGRRGQGRQLLPRISLRRHPDAAQALHDSTLGARDRMRQSPAAAAPSAPHRH